ncbi:MAG: hypothetical protein J6Y62_07085 [Clostridia bacterium]|nr:hypothetical protein [Clostridia bacterium]
MNYDVLGRPVCCFCGWKSRSEESMEKHLQRHRDKLKVLTMEYSWEKGWLLYSEPMQMVLGAEEGFGVFCMGFSCKGDSDDRNPCYSYSYEDKGPDSREKALAELKKLVEEDLKKRAEGIERLKEVWPCRKDALRRT